MGVSVYRHKVFAFVISAGFAGLAGALYSYSEQYISPNTYNFELTILFLLAIIMGGRKTAPARCWARPSSCCCPRCWTTSPPSG